MGKEGETNRIGEEWAMAEALRPISSDETTGFSAILRGAIRWIQERTGVTALEVENRHLRAENEMLRGLATPGILASGIAHDNRRPLAVIGLKTFLGFQELKKENPDIGKIRRIFEEIDAEVGKGAETANLYLGLTHGEVPQLERLGVNLLVNRQVDRLMARQLENIEIEIDLLELPPALAHEGILMQVLENIAENALQAMGGGGTLTFASYQSGDYIAIEIGDTGSGIPKEIQDKIFDPLFTTREQGTGLGLALCRYLVEEIMRGRITFTSTPGVGSTFTVLLPAEA